MFIEPVFSPLQHCRREREEEGIWARIREGRERQREGEKEKVKMESETGRENLIWREGL